MSSGHAIYSEGPPLMVYLTPRPPRMGFSATMSVHPFTINPVKPHFLKMWLFLLWPGNLNFALVRASITCLLVAQSHVLQVDTDGRDDLADVDPDHCALRLSKDTCFPVWGLDGGEHEVRHECPLSPRSLEATHTGQQAAHTTKEGTVCSHCTLGPMGKEHIWLNWLQTDEPFYMPIQSQFLPVCRHCIPSPLFKNIDPVKLSCPHQLSTA